MTAEGDGLALIVASIGVVAIPTPQIDQGKVPRLDLDAAQLAPFRSVRTPASAGEARVTSVRPGELRRACSGLGLAPGDDSGGPEAISPIRLARLSTALRV